MVQGLMAILAVPDDMRRWKPYRGTRSFVTFDGHEIAYMDAAINRDREACPECKAGTPVPHNTGFASITKGEAYTFQCRSFSRWYNPETHQMEGRHHCTCDSCF